MLPDAWHMVLAPTNTYQRAAQWQAAFPVIKATVQAGEEILVHCMAGRHRAAAVGVLLRAIFTGESIPQADSWISQRRNIELHRIAYDKGVGQWLKDTLQKSQVGMAWPTVTGFVATSRSNLHLRTTEMIPLCAHKQSATKALERLSYPIQCTRVSEASAWNRPVCTVCLGRAPASWRACCERLDLCGGMKTVRLLRFLTICHCAGVTHQLHDRGFHCLCIMFILGGGYPMFSFHHSRREFTLTSRSLPCTPELAGELLGLKASGLASPYRASI